MPYPDFVETPNRSTPDQIQQQIKLKIAEYNKKNIPLDFVVIVMDRFQSNKPQFYDSVKKFCDGLGLHTQFIQSRTMSNPKGILSKACNIIKQINSKINNDNYQLELPRSIS